VVSEQVADIGEKLSEISIGEARASALQQETAYIDQISGLKRRLDRPSTKLKEGKRSLTGFHLSTSRPDKMMYLRRARQALANGS